jgi:hypothetical protein
MIAGQIEIEMLANLARLTTDMNKATGIVGNSMKSIERSIGQAKAVLGSFGIGLSAFGLERLIAGGLETADSMGKLAQKTGVSIESLSQMRIAADLAGVNIETLAKGMEKISQSAAMASSGVSNQKKTFDALGISTLDAAGKMKNADELMREVADRFAGINDGAGKTAAAMALFGKAGAEMIPMLNRGGDELDRMAKLSDKLGLTLNGQTTEAAERVNDNFTTMGLALKGAGMAILDRMLPSLVSMTNAMVDAVSNGTALKTMADDLVMAAKVMASGFMTADFVLKSFGDTIGAVIAAGNEALHGNFSGAAAALKSTQDDAKARTQEFVDSISKMWDDTAKAQDNVQNKVGVKKDFNLALGTGTEGGKASRKNALQSEYEIEGQLQLDALERDIQHQKDYEEAIFAIKVDAMNRKLEIQAMTNAQLADMLMQGNLSIIDIENLSAQQRVGTAITGFSKLIGAAGQHSQAMFSISKALALAQGAIELPKTVMSAYKWGTEMGGPLLGVAYAAVAGAAQLINLNAIKSASFGGGGSSAPSAGGTSGLPGQEANTNVVGAEQAPQVKQTTAVTINLTDGFYTAEAVRNLIEKINDQVHDGAQLAQIRVS